jgi:hypothetical protein
MMMSLVQVFVALGSKSSVNGIYQNGGSYYWERNDYVLESRIDKIAR